MKVRFLTDDAGSKIIESLSQKDTVDIQVHRAKIIRLEIQTETYEEIMKLSRACDNFQLFFKTPTYLPSIGRPFYDLYPDPVKVFTNLYRLWCKFNPAAQLTKDGFEKCKKWLLENSGITAQELHTVTVPFGKKRRPASKAG